MDAMHVETASDDGLEALVNRAARVAEGDKHTPVGVLGIVLENEPNYDLLIEVAFALRDGKRVVDRLDARVRLHDHTASTELVSAALAGFGGQGFTSVTAAPVGLSRSSAFDITISFAPRFPWRATNTVLPPDDPSPEQKEVYERILDVLGVKHAGLSVPHAELRGRLRLAAQVEAFQIGVAAGYRTTLYAARLPTSQSMQVEQGSEDGRPYLDCFIGHGLSPDVFCTPSDAAHIQRFLKDHLDVDLGRRSYLVENVYADARIDAADRPRHKLPWPLGSLSRD